LEYWISICKISGATAKLEAINQKGEQINLSDHPKDGWFKTEI